MKDKNKIVGDTRVIGHRICMHVVQARKLYSIRFYALIFWGLDDLLFVHRVKFVFGALINLPLVGKGPKYDILRFSSRLFTTCSNA